MALNPASATKASPGTTRIVRPPISAQAALVPSPTQVTMNATPIQTKNGVEATTIIKIAAELSLSEGRTSPGTWRNRNETARRMNSPITKNNKKGLVFTSCSGKMPEVWASNPL